MSEALNPLVKSDQNLVWLDCEMTGLNPEHDRILEIAVVVTGPHLAPRVEGPVFAIHQRRPARRHGRLEQGHAWQKRAD
jgi:oligoribonuclease